MIAIVPECQSEEIRFFDKLAWRWDSRLKERDFSAIEQLLEEVNFKPVDSVLDIGTGTGIMIPYYQKLGILQIIAVDSSLEMCKIVSSKYPALTIVCASYPDWTPENKTFDKIVMFNSFPHLEGKKRVYKKSFDLLCPSGSLVIAHSMNRVELASCHRRKGRAVENHLLPDNDSFIKDLNHAGFTNIDIKETPGFFMLEAVRQPHGICI
jgi:cyclopropane fatty-acyl-phospholipid synthase-like methyltransferase